MSNLPFNLAGSLAQALRPTAGSHAIPAPPVEMVPTRSSGSRRGRLWALSHRLHCPVIGVCFSCDELRALMKKVIHFPPDTSDYVLHTTAVGTCEQRGRLAELLQRTLEVRHRLTVKSLAGLKSTAELQAAWCRACREGGDIPGMLWACLTHPALDTTLEQEIYGDIHMLQHQLGAGTRVDIRALQRLREENAGLRRQLAQAGAAVDQARAEREAATSQSELMVRELRGELVAVTATGERLAREFQALQESLPELRDAQLLLRRVASLEMQADGLRQRAALLERERDQLRDFVRHAEETIASLAVEAEVLPNAPDRDLSGKRVLCVGGRSGSLKSYRDVVEQSGGEFLHHDGGLEESLQRIDSIVAAADIVICQAGCISHNAYWRVKEHCKRTGKRCVFVKNAGVSSFDRAMDVAGRVEE
ncbi:MAG: DUF2325 domain-containing protein [Rhodocyclaceae bacterium]